MDKQSQSGIRNQIGVDVCQNQVGNQVEMDGQLDGYGQRYPDENKQTMTSKGQKVK